MIRNDTRTGTRGVSHVRTRICNEYRGRRESRWFMRAPGIWHGMKHICCISPLWQPLTYFLPFVLPYNSSENIINYARKSEEGRTGQEQKKNEGTHERGGGGGRGEKRKPKEFHLPTLCFYPDPPPLPAQLVP